MAFIRCSVEGCNQKLQPILKPDLWDRETWIYPECDVCFRSVCDQHATEKEGIIVCHLCRREIAARQQPEVIIVGIGSR